VAAHTFGVVLRLLHPAMPFITDALYRRLPGRGDASIVIALWPGADAGRDDRDAERDFAFVQALVNAVREVRAEYDVKPGTTLPVMVSMAGERQRGAIAAERAMIVRLAKAARLTDLPGETSFAGRIGSHALLPEGAEVFVELGEAIDVARECDRLTAELARLDRQLVAVRAKLASESFLGRAPAEVVEREREKERQWSAKRQALAAKLAALGCV
jgi:valyl-tRNA synthetase